MTKDWDANKDTLIQLYIKDGMKLDDLRVHMARMGFNASPRAYRQRFQKWGIGKYQKRSSTSLHPVPRNHRALDLHGYHSRSGPGTHPQNHTQTLDYQQQGAPPSPPHSRSHSQSLPPNSYSLSIPHQYQHTYPSPPLAMSSAHLSPSAIPLDPKLSPTSPRSPYPAIGYPTLQVAVDPVKYEEDYNYMSASHSHGKPTDELMMFQHGDFAGYPLKNDPYFWSPTQGFSTHQLSFYTTNGATSPPPPKNQDSSVHSRSDSGDFGTGTSAAGSIYNLSWDMDAEGEFDDQIEADGQEFGEDDYLREFE